MFILSCSLQIFNPVLFCVCVCVNITLEDFFLHKEAFYISSKILHKLEKFLQ